MDFIFNVDFILNVVFILLLICVGVFVMLFAYWFFTSDTSTPNPGMLYSKNRNTDGIKYWPEPPKKR